jgi:glycerate kinase
VIRRILIAPDSFKDALSSDQVAAAIADGIRAVRRDISIELLPLADGGEGTLYRWQEATGGTLHTTWVCDPLFRAVRASWGRSADGRSAVIEMAQASGLELLAPQERNALFTSTFGTGELIRAAIDTGVEEIYLTLGGSATNDGGLGMAVALGLKIRDQDGKPLLPTGASLARIGKIEGDLSEPLSQVKITALTDVNNPLLGPTGATAVYACQKGVAKEDQPGLEQGLEHLTNLWEKASGNSCREMPGAGAAGGLGWGCCAFLGAELRSATEQLFTWTELDRHLSTTDLLITGEGHFDGQTQQGKLVSALASRAALYNIPLYVVCGRTTAQAKAQFPFPIAAISELSPDPNEPLPTAIEHTATRLKAVAAGWAANW